MITGLARFGGRTIAFMGHQKGRDVHERTRRNFGMTFPEGYRKAMRVMDLAERHRFPIISLIDTPGAYPGVAAEQHGQGGAIARSQARMARLTVPITACVIGEGGSGGAIATALADRVLMQENAMYTVISPEGCAAILWRDAGEKVKAAAALKPDAANCLQLGVIDAVVPSPRVERTRIPTRRRACSARRCRARSRISRTFRATSCGATAARVSAHWACFRTPRWVSPARETDLERHDLVRARQRARADVLGDRVEGLRFNFLDRRDLSPIGYEKVQDTGESVPATR